MSGKRVWIALLTLVMLIQSVALFCWADRKNYYWEDDYYSFQEAHYYLKDDFKSYDKYFVQADFFSYGKWIENKKFRNTFIVGENESLLSVSPLRAVKKLLKGRTYFGLLNIHLSLFSKGDFNAAKALWLNILFMVFTDLFIYLIMRKMNASEGASLAAVILYGFSYKALDMALFVRFYAFDTLLYLAVFYLHLLILKGEDRRRNLMYELASLFFLFVALRNSELVFVLFSVTAAAFILAFVLKKEYKKTIDYLLTVMLLGLAYLFLKTDFIRILLNPGRFAGDAGRLGEVINSMKGMGFSAFTGNLIKMIQSFHYGLFANVWFGRAALLFFIASLAFYLTGKKKLSLAGENTLPVTAAAIITVSYASFTFAANLIWGRYYIFIVPLVAVILVRCTEKIYEEAEARKTIFTALSVFVLLCCILNSYHITNAGNELEYRAFREKIRPYAAYDAAVLRIEDSPYCNTTQYDCVPVMSDESGICTLSSTNLDLRPVLSRKKVLIWINKGENVNGYFGKMTGNGYRLKKLATSVFSDVYLAERKGGN